MKVFIIDSDTKFVDQVEKALKVYNPDIKILGKLNSLKKSIQWFQVHETPDLVFMDIEFSEEIDFETFEQLLISVPIIFTTEYKDYIVRVFKENGIDFLLKPFDKDEFTVILEKFEKIVETSINNERTDVIDNVMKILNKEFKKRFVIKEKGEIRSISVVDIAYFYIKNKKVQIITTDKQNYSIDYTLDLLERLIDPELFFRVNPDYLINKQSIIDSVLTDHEEYELRLRQNLSEIVRVDKAKALKFKYWLES